MPEGTPGNGQGPWSTAVSQAFGDDPALAARVSQFMQTHYQPYVTRLENERAQSTEAVQFYNRFQEDAGEAFLELAEQLFDQDGVEAIVSALAGDEPAPEVEGTVESEEETAVANLSPEQQELLEWAAAKRAEDQASSERQQYEQLKKEWIESDESRKAAIADPELFDPFVAANDGDFDAAFDAYSKFQSRFAPAVEDAPAAPPTLNTGATAPPTEGNYKTFDEAWDAFEAEQRALKPAPPTV